MEKPSVLQKTVDIYDAAGRLDPAGFDQHIAFTTFPPLSDLAPFIEHFWSISWDRAAGAPYISEQLMHRPFVDVFISQPESGIQCTFRGRRDYRADGEGRILGARFRPGAFHAFWQASLAGLHDQTIYLQAVFPMADRQFVQSTLAQDDQSAIDILAGLIRTKKPQPDPYIDLINHIISAVESDDDLSTVRSLARRFHRSERWLQQLFSEYVGLGLKWLLKRTRLIAAARCIRDNAGLDWAGLAYDLGYSSQQHFITDFRRVLGKTPVQYKRSLTI